MLSKTARQKLGLVRQPSWNKKDFLQPLEQDNYKFQALSNDPQLITSTRSWLPGWYMLELAIEHDQPNAVAELFFDTGNGFNAKQSLRLPLPQAKVIKRVFYVPFGMRALRLDPISAEGCFTIAHCQLVWLKPSFAKSRILQRLRKVHSQYKNLASTTINLELKKQARQDGLPWRETALQAYQSTFEHSVAGVNYSWWLEQQAERRQEQLQTLQRQQSEWTCQPVISILLPVYNTPPALLAECINSVTAQLYSNWQLCIADDASTSEDTRHALQQLCVGDERIKLVQRENNGHISAASNSALEVATGDYVALLDHDDLLSPDALLKVVAAINQHPDALLLYSDEDKVDEQGKRYDPHFKPGWNPDLLLSQNYISHLGVYQRQRMVNIGGFREGLEGSQDHDLVLRFTHGLLLKHIVHIPEVLYHWRAVAGSTALGSSEKSYAHQAGLNALQQYVSKQHPQASVSSTSGDYYRITWPLPSPAPLVSLLVPTRDGVDILAPCVNAILEKTDYRHFELIILDNQSSCPRTLEYMQQVSERDERVRVLRWDHPFNYSAINNFGASQAKGSIIGLINNDVEPINAGWLSEMVSQVCRPEIGCVGAKLYYPNGSLQHAGVILGIGGVAGHSHKYFNGNALGYFSRLQLVQNLSAVTAACLLVRKEIFEQVGGLNEENLKVAFNDVDFCLKVREAGYRNLFTPFAELYHHESVSRGAEDNPKKQARFQAEIAYMRKTWGPQLDNDPAYNPNLTLAYEDFSLRCLSS